MRLHVMPILALSLMTLSPVMLRAQKATIVASDTEFEYTSARSAVCRRHLEVRVNSEHGASAAVFGCYCSDNISLSKFTGRVTDASDKVVFKVKQGDLLRTEYSKELVSDQYAYLFAYESHRYPYTVIYDWEERHEGGICALPMFAPQIDYDVEVKAATYRIISTDRNAFSYRAIHFDPEVRKSTDNKGRQVFEVSVHDLPAIPYYGYGVPLSSRVPLLYVAPLAFDMRGTHCDLTDWNTFGLWVHSLRQGRDQLPDALVRRLKAATDTCQSDRSRVAVVRRMVADNTRYVSIQNGINGYQPMSVGDVYKKGIGDCKALVNYFCSMLQALGIQAQYALISSEQNRLLDMPNMQQLDHVIAQVPLPGDTLWVECTNPSYPYDHLPADLHDHDVVIITAEGGQLSRTPVLADADHSDMNHYDISLAAKGDAVVQFEEYGCGMFFDRYLPLLTMSATDQRKTMLSLLDLSKSSINDIRVNLEGDVLHLSIGLQSQSYAKRTGNRLFVPLCPVPFSGLRNANEPPHTLCLDGMGMVETDTIVFHLPEGSSLEHLPEAAELTSSFGSFTMAPCQLEDGTVQVMTRLTLQSGTYDESLYEEWVTFRKSVATLCNGKMVVVINP